MYHLGEGLWGHSGIQGPCLAANHPQIPDDMVPVLFKDFAYNDIIRLSTMVLTVSVPVHLGVGEKEHLKGPVIARTL